ncbi:hypothetical protein B0T10DRAFT_498731 [Thelonectria olida]|uniref:Secreted protein n=1 Tax=Thelonectria olida TaxID=1576542 RepID=A0A9P8VTM9_9HYPO|nr:hypothetical protein B0T10DRAFT_498731 [Thelonectria olida]
MTSQHLVLEIASLFCLVYGRLRTGQASSRPPSRAYPRWSVTFRRRACFQITMSISDSPACPLFFTNNFHSTS